MYCTERKTKYNKRRRLQQISNGKERDAYARAFESGTTRGAMRSAALAWCHITAEHNVLSYRYTYPEPSVFFFFLARTSFPPPSPHIVHSLPIFILHAVFLIGRLLRSPSRRSITRPPPGLAKINQTVLLQCAHVPETARAIITGIRIVIIL